MKFGQAILIAFQGLEHQRRVEQQIVQARHDANGKRRLTLWARAGLHCAFP
ncbi:MAG: hypothetical protein GTO41_21515 [Burkholderiales bacterium]|nr:hypothetical protein [Burkholderiales bacterium]